MWNVIGQTEQEIASLVEEWLKRKTKKKKNWCSNQTLFTIKSRNILPQNGTEERKKGTNNAENVRYCVFRLLSVHTDLQIGYSSKLNLQLVFSW